MVEGKAAPGMVETDLGQSESQGAQGAAILAQDPRPDGVVATPIPQLEFRPDVVIEKKSKKSFVGKVASKFLVKSRIKVCKKTKV